MVKWVILGILLYLICGCVMALILQLLANSDNNDASFYGCSSDEVPFVIAVWPMALLIFIFALFIPWLLKKFYTGFIAIIFLIIALFKKEKK